MKKTFSEIILLTLGSIMFATGIYFFRMPNNFVVGGASGLGIILSKIIPAVSKSEFVSLINIACVIFGIIFLGKKFSWKTVYCSIVYSAFLLLLEHTVIINNPLTDDMIIDLVMSIILCGVGVGLVIDAGGSTGGIEILALIASKRTHHTIGTSLMVFNLIIAISSALLFGVKTCFVSVIGVLAHSIIVDNVIKWLNSEKVMLIVTENSEKICEYIHSKLNANATLVNSVGAYSNKENRFIIAVLTPKKAATLKKKIKRMNCGDFVVSMDTFDLMGGKI